MIRGAHAAPPVERKSSDLRRTMRLFWRFKGGNKVYVGAIALLVFEALTAVVEPYPIAYLIDFLQRAVPSLRHVGLPSILPSERIETLVLLTLAIVLIATVNSAADSFAEVCMARGGRTFGYRIRVAMYSHLQRLSLGYHDKKRTGDVLTRVTGDVLVLEDFIVGSVSNVLGSGMVLVGTFAVLMYQSWNVALVALTVVPVLAWISHHFSQRIKAVSKTQRSREGELASTAQEMLTSIRLVQSYGRGKVDLEQFSDQTEHSMQAALRTANVQAKFSFVIAIVEALAICMVVWIGLFLLDQKAITIGTLVLFILLLQNMFKPARKIVSEWYKIGKVFASVDRISELLEREVDVRDEPGAVEAPVLQGHLAFRHVRFAYGGEHADGSPDERRPVLRDIDFEVVPGEVVALVGSSGAGKSTIAQLVPRLYDPIDGAVLLDGHDVRSLTLSSVRSQVSLVLQDTILLSGTVAENIGYGVPDATAARIEAAARAANAHDFIQELPEGYDTRIAERGTTLSGGQRQRLAIARAFIRETPILILDEPTTGLDTESTRLVLGALSTLMHGKTTIIISHDPGLIRCAERVLRIDDGIVVEEPQPSHADSAYVVAGVPPVESGTKTKARVSRVHRPVQALADPLHERLPGFAKATDPEFAAHEVERLLLDNDSGREVQDARVEKLWFRPDGTCTLRYVVRLADRDGDRSEQTVLVRVHPDDDAAQAYLTGHVESVARLASAPTARQWRQRTAVVRGTGVALHPFPIDPGLSTLVRAADPRVIADVLRQHVEPCGAEAGAADTDTKGIEGTEGTEGTGGLRSDVTGDWSVRVVHYPREGSCMLRYDRTSAEGGATIYGKVYDDGRGQITAATLQNLAKSHRLDDQRDCLRVPQVLGYERSIHLLLTKAVPGEPLLRHLLRPGSSAWSTRPDRADRKSVAVRDAVASAGRVLASLHGRVPHTGSYAPCDAPAGDTDSVRQLWPDVAEQLQCHLGPLLDRTNDLAQSEHVLCHGDFTPAQLLAGPDGMALVDLDTACRADPALDLGRFLAHVQLAGIKATGDAAWPLLDELAGAFLRSYVEARPPAVQLDRKLLDRIRLYRDASLVRTAYRACRQLKDERLGIALAMLADNDDWTRRIDP